MGDYVLQFSGRHRFTSMLKIIAQALREGIHVCTDSRYNLFKYHTGRRVAMLQTIEAVTDQNGVLRFSEPVKLPGRRRVIITVLNEEAADDITNLALLSEPALARDWDRPEEDEAWSSLAQLPSL